MSSGSEAIRAALVFIALVTAWRVVALWFNGTDLFVDEAQYWAWGQYPDFGYFSKPPLIGWLIGGVTGLVGSDAAFVVRLPAPLLHGLTALLVIWAARSFVDGWVAAWAGALYVSMPLIAVGSALMSTDTVMLPFFALALGLYGRLIEAPSLLRAAAMGAAVGAGLMAKYAMIYFLLGAFLVWLFQPSQRIRLREAALSGIVALAVFAPNIWWNIANDGQTVRHVLEDNAGVDEIDPMLSEGAIFLAEQAGIFGPILFLALLVAAFRRPRGGELSLLLFSLPTIGVVTVQAVLSGALANWAAAAYVAAPIVAASVLQMRRGLLVASALYGVAFAVAIPLLMMFPDAVLRTNGEPLANRYLGLHAVSDIAAEKAREAGLSTITARERGLLADLTYTLHEEGFDVRAWGDPSVAPKSWYHAEFLASRPTEGPVAFLGHRAPDCAGLTLLGPVDPGFGDWAGRGLKLWRVDAGC
ncbi:MAG: glycosyltransferase family 39 protein [Pseudomonadota bacterium]